MSAQIHFGPSRAASGVFLVSDELVQNFGRKRAPIRPCSAQIRPGLNSGNLGRNCSDLGQASACNPREFAQPSFRSADSAQWSAPHPAPQSWCVKGMISATSGCLDLTAPTAPGTASSTGIMDLWAPQNASCVGRRRDWHATRCPTMWGFQRGSHRPPSTGWRTNLEVNEGHPMSSNCDCAKTGASACRSGVSKSAYLPPSQMLELS